MAKETSKRLGIFVGLTCGMQNKRSETFWLTLQSGQIDKRAKKKKYAGNQIKVEIRRFGCQGVMEKGHQIQAQRKDFVWKARHSYTEIQGSYFYRFLFLA